MFYKILLGFGGRYTLASPFFIIFWILSASAFLSIGLLPKLLGKNSNRSLCFLA